MHGDAFSSYGVAQAARDVTVHPTHFCSKGLLSQRSLHWPGAQRAVHRPHSFKQPPLLLLLVSSSCTMGTPPPPPQQQRCALLQRTTTLSTTILIH